MAYSKYTLSIISIFVTIAVIAVSSIPQIMNPDLTFAIKVILWCMIGSYALTIVLHLRTTEKIDEIKAPSHSWINKKCYKLLVAEDKTYEKEIGQQTVCYIAVRCEDGLITEGGCVENCPNFKRPVV